MNNVVEFYKFMGAVLAANLLTVAFVWGIIGYSRLEGEGREKDRTAGKYLTGILLAFGFLGGAIYLAFIASA